MNPGDSTERARRQRYGVCHRCGWKGSVAKVARRDRKRLKTGRTFARLCDDCVNDLLNHQASPAKPARLKSAKHRNVA